MTWKRRLHRTPEGGSSRASDYGATLSRFSGFRSGEDGCYRRDTLTVPISYRIDLERQFVMTQASGVLSGREILEHKARLINDPAYDPSMPQLSDLLGIERVEITADDIKAMAQFDAAHVDRRPTHRLAVAATNEVAFGMTRMYQARADGNRSDIRAFRTVEEALFWLTSAKPSGAGGESG